VGWCVLSCLCFIITGWECLCYRLLSVCLSICLCLWCHVLFKKAYAASLIHCAVLWSTSLNRMLYWGSCTVADSFSRLRSTCSCRFDKLPLSWGQPMYGVGLFDRKSGNMETICTAKCFLVLLLSEVFQICTTKLYLGLTDPSDRAV
jgi:hypothetical protein